MGATDGATITMPSNVDTIFRLFGSMSEKQKLLVTDGQSSYMRIYLRISTATPSIINTSAAARYGNP